MTKKEFILEVIRKWEMVESNTDGFTNELIGGEFISNDYTVGIFENAYTSKDVPPRFVCIIKKMKIIGSFSQYYSQILLIQNFLK